MSEESPFFPSSYADSGTGEVEATFARAETGAVAHPRISSKKEDKTIAEPEGQLTIDVYQTPTDIVIESAVAGVDPEDLDIHVSNDSVTIRGSRRRDSEVREEDYLYQECYWGRFSRSIILPQEIDAEAATAAFNRNGVLRVTLPKMNRQRAKKLKVKLE